MCGLLLWLGWDDLSKRRDSVSSTSSGDSGTPIDGPFDAEQGTIINPYVKVSCCYFIIDVHCLGIIFLVFASTYFNLKTSIYLI